MKRRLGTILRNIYPSLLWKGRLIPIERFRVSHRTVKILFGNDEKNAKRCEQKSKRR